MGKFVVYKHTNKINNKVYIGITSLSIDDRWRNGDGYKNCRYFYRAILKYGWDAFDHTILFKGLNKAEAEQKEIELISLLESNDCEKGYNITKGGSGINGFSHSEETKRRFSEMMSGKGNPMFGRTGINSPHYGKKYTKTHCQKISQGLQGKSKSEEHCRKLSEVAKGRKYSSEACRNMGESHYKQVAQYTANGEIVKIWNGIIVASKELGINRGSISGCCRGEKHRKTAGGFIWRFVGEGDAIEGG